METDLDPTDVVLICHTCGDRGVFPLRDYEGQRTFRKNHAWPCQYGSGGKPWSKHPGGGRKW